MVEVQDEITMEVERSAPTRCDVCGKFRKQEDLSGMCGEDGEWVECGWCMSGYDYEQHYGKKRELTMEVGE